MALQWVEALTDEVHNSTGDPHTQYPLDTEVLKKTGLTEWDEQAGDPSTPASGKWKLYFKAGGLYLIDDLGAVTGPLGTGGGGGALDDLSDVTITSVGTDEILGYSGGWINRTLAEAGIAPVASPTFTGQVTTAALDVSGLLGMVQQNTAVGATGTLTPTKAYTAVSPNTGTTDDLDNIAAGGDGDILYLIGTTGNDIYITNSGNIKIVGGGSYPYQLTANEWVVLMYDAGNTEWRQIGGTLGYTQMAEAGTTFTGLTDTPTDYDSAANKLVVVNGTPDAVEFRNLSDFDAMGSYDGTNDLLLVYDASATQNKYGSIYDVVQGVGVVKSAGADQIVQANADNNIIFIVREYNAASGGPSTTQDYLFTVECDDGASGIDRVLWVRGSLSRPSMGTDYYMVFADLDSDAPQPASNYQALFFKSGTLYKRSSSGDAVSVEGSSGFDGAGTVSFNVKALQAAAYDDGDSGGAQFDAGFWSDPTSGPGKLGHWDISGELGNNISRRFTFDLPIPAWFDGSTMNITIRFFAGVDATPNGGATRIIEVYDAVASGSTPTNLYGGSSVSLTTTIANKDFAISDPQGNYVSVQVTDNINDSGGSTLAVSETYRIQLVIGVA